MTESPAQPQPLDVEALLSTAELHDYRVPHDDCRPHAVTAAAAPALVTALLGLDPDIPNGTITFDPPRPSPVGAFRVRGLKVGTGELDVSVTASGDLTVHNGPIAVEFRMADGSPARIGRP